MAGLVSQTYDFFRFLRRPQKCCQTSRRMSIARPVVRLGHISSVFKPFLGRAVKYLCLMFIDEKMYDSLPQREQDACVRKHLAYDDELREGGQLIATEALQSVKTAVTLRVSNGKVSITDGPYAETKEQLGGFYLVEARDLNDAIRIASRIPAAPMGSIEVRPILELNPALQSVAQ
jgi:hypothetical protein